MSFVPGISDGERLVASRNTRTFITQATTITSKGNVQYFKTFDEFKKTLGAAGEGKAWHHIVEQNAVNIEKFGAEAIHNTTNVIKIPAGAGSLHAKVTGYYNSIKPFTNGVTVREWLKTKNYQEHYDFGIKVLKEHGWQ